MNKASVALAIMMAVLASMEARAKGRERPDGSSPAAAKAPLADVSDVGWPGWSGVSWSPDRGSAS